MTPRLVYAIIKDARPEDLLADLHVEIKQVGPSFYLGFAMNMKIDCIKKNSCIFENIQVYKFAII